MDSVHSRLKCLPWQVLHDAVASGKRLGAIFKALLVASHMLQVKGWPNDGTKPGWLVGWLVGKEGGSGKRELLPIDLKK